MTNGPRVKTSFELHLFIEKREPLLDADIGPAIADVYAMATLIAAEGFDAISRFSMKTLHTNRRGTTLVEEVAQELSRSITGPKADIFRKALQETMLDAASLGHEPQKLNVKLRLESYLKKRGAKQFLVIFLSSYVFNTVWIKIQESIREESGSQALGKSMLGLSRECTSVVKSVVDDWQAQKKLEQLLTKKHLGAALIKAIDVRLREDFK
jgi:hypothetical protein